MCQHPEPKPRDDRDTAQDIARDLAEIAGQLASLKGEANAYLRDPNYTTLRFRLESAHSGDSRLQLWRLEKEDEAQRGR
jgi:hypothetical protein